MTAQDGNTSVYSILLGCFCSSGSCPDVRISQTAEQRHVSECVSAHILCKVCACANAMTRHACVNYSAYQYHVCTSRWYTMHICDIVGLVFDRRCLSSVPFCPSVSKNVGRNQQARKKNICLVFVNYDTPYAYHYWLVTVSAIWLFALNCMNSSWGESICIDTRDKCLRRALFFFYQIVLHVKAMATCRCCKYYENLIKWRLVPSEHVQIVSKKHDQRIHYRIWYIHLSQAYDVCTGAHAILLVCFVYSYILRPSSKADPDEKKRMGIPSGLGRCSVGFRKWTEMDEF